MNPYGGDKLKLLIRGRMSSNVRLEIKRSEVEALDKPSQRCDPSEDEPSVAKCVEQHMENSFNCSFKRLMSNPILGNCNRTTSNSSKYRQYNDMIVWLATAEGREIFEKTGCIPGCSKSKIDMKSLNSIQEDLKDDGRREFRLTFHYLRAEYDLKKEYYIYNWGSFIADVGGYLGLLLGCSVLSIYQMTAPLLTRMVKKMAKATGEYYQYH